MVLERVQRRRAQDADLAHAAAQHLAEAARALDVVAAAGDHRADRRAEALREAGGHACRTAPPGRARARRVATAAFQMRAPSRCSASPPARARATTAVELRARPDAAAAAVVRVLDRDQARARQVAIGGQRRRVDVVGGERPVGAADLGELHARPGRARARFVEARVRAAPDDHLVAGPAVEEQRDLVRHRAARARTAPPPCRAARRPAPPARAAVGSSPQTSSPTSAPAIAARIAGVGRVNVSDRRSTRLIAAPASDGAHGGQREAQHQVDDVISGLVAERARREEAADARDDLVEIERRRSRALNAGDAARGSAPAPAPCRCRPDTM